MALSLADQDRITYRDALALTDTQVARLSMADLKKLYVAAGGGSGGGGVDSHVYVRPTDWLALPTVLSSDQKFVGLYAVYNHESNFVAVQCQAAYTVDWGDGTAPENFASNVQANHNYVYANVASGSLCSRGYRQAIITITPQAGQNLTKVDLTVRHTQASLGTYNTSWLDIRMAGSFVSTLTISNAASVYIRMLEQFEYVGTSAVTTCANKFQSCTGLQSFIGTAWTASVTSMASMFNGCTSLQTVPSLNCVAVTTMASMFSGCTALYSVPAFNSGVNLTVSGMFTGCVALRDVGLFNTASVTTMNSMFSGCTTLQTVPLFNTISVTIMTSMFTSCSSLRTVPLFNTINVTTMSGMFSSCMTLQTVPLFNTINVIDMSSMFSGCVSLDSIPLFNTISCSNFNSMFASCASLGIGAMSGTRTAISYASCRLGATNLDAIYTNLGVLNMLSANAANVETSIADWSTNIVNCTVTWGFLPAGVEGASRSVKMTSVASGEMTAAITTRIAVSPSTQYTFLSKVKATTTGRACRVAIAWYDVGGVLISTDTGSDITSLTTAHLQALVTATSPSNAATASLILSVTATAAAQVQDWDTMGFYPGTVTVWSPGLPQAITVSTNWGTTADTPAIATAKGWTVTGS